MDANLFPIAKKLKIEELTVEKVPDLLATSLIRFPPNRDAYWRSCSAKPPGSTMLTGLARCFAREDRRRSLKELELRRIYVAANAFARKVQRLQLKGDASAGPHTIHLENGEQITNPPKNLCRIARGGF